MKYKHRFFAFFLAMILFSLSSNFAHPVTPTIIQDLHLNDYMFGVALAMMQLANFLMSPFWGKINNYISSRVSLLICCCGYGIAQVWFAYATTEPMIICARLFAGAFVGGIFVSFLTYVVNVAKPEDQAKYLTYSATIHSVAGAFGYLIGGVLGEFSIKGTFLVQAVTLIATGILFYAVSLPDGQAKEEISYKKLAKDANPLKAFLECGQFMTVAFAALFAVNILINFGNTGFDQAFNYYLKDQLSLSSSYNGIIKAAVGLVSFVSNMTLCIWIINKTNAKRSMALLCGVCTAAAIGALLAPNIGLFIGFSILVYAGYSVSLPVLQNIVASQADPQRKNLVMGFYNATKSLGSIAGSLTAGFIYSVHVKLPFACTAVIYGLSMAAAIGYLACCKKQK
ncbi:MAG: MFS transporter [Oscillospiraceae bacterium]|nr:MFS transporter [Oscillospiraceae bacterium]